MEKKVLEYILKERPAVEERPAEPMSPGCEIGIVIPCSGERRHILRPIGSLATQEGIGCRLIEIIVVVYDRISETAALNSETWNGGSTGKKEGHTSLAENDNPEVIDLLRCIKGGGAKPRLYEGEAEVVEIIKKSGIKIHICDLYSSGAGITAGEAKNKGTAELVARFYDRKKNGLIVQLDACARIEPGYIQTALDLFARRPGLICAVGRELPDFQESPPPLTSLTAELLELHDTICRYLIYNHRLPESVFYDYSGSYNSNILSLAFETAAVGGIPLQHIYEISTLEEKLSTLGITDRAPRLITKTCSGVLPADDPAKKNIDLSKYVLDLQETGTINVRSPKYYKTMQRITSQVNEAIDNGAVNRENLRHILSVDGIPLLAAGETAILCERLAGSVLLEKQIETDPVLRILFDKISAGVDAKIPRISIEDAVARLKKVFLNNEERVFTYNMTRERVTRGARMWQEGFNKLLEIYYEQRPEHMDYNSLVEMLRSKQGEIGIDDEFILMLEVKDFDLYKISEILTHAETKEEAAGLVKIHFSTVLLPPEQTGEPIKRPAAEVHDADKGDSAQKKSAQKNGDYSQRLAGVMLLELRTLREMIYGITINSISRSKTVDTRSINRNEIPLHNGRIDLRDATFIIPVRIDSQDRQENMDIIISYLNKHFDTNIFVLEADSQRHLYLNESHIEYVFIEDANSYFYKTKYLNMMISRIRTPLIVDFDCDALLDEYQLAKGITLVRKKILDVCYPFDGNFLDLQDKGPVRDGTGINNLNPRTLRCLCPDSFGGIVIFNTAVYKEGGMENEYIKGWAPEDYERYVRYRKLGYKVGRIPGPLFHLAHGRGANSSYRNPYFYESQREFEFLRIMNKKQLAKYIKTWAWLDRTEGCVVPGSREDFK